MFREPRLLGEWEVIYSLERKHFPWELILHDHPQPIVFVALHADDIHCNILCAAKQKRCDHILFLLNFPSPSPSPLNSPFWFTSGTSPGWFLVPNHNSNWFLQLHAWWRLTRTDSTGRDLKGWQWDHWFGGTAGQHLKFYRATCHGFLCW